MAVRLNDGTWGEGAEEVWGWHYDRYPLLSTRTGAQRLYTAVPGDTRFGVQLSYGITNNISKGSVPDGWKLEYYKIHMRYLAAEARTQAEVQLLNEYLRQLVLRLVVEGKYKLFEGSAVMFRGADQKIDTAAAGQVPTGFAVYMGCVELEIPIVLQERTPWYFELDQIAAPAAGLDADNLHFDLEGRLIHRQ